MGEAERVPNELAHGLPSTEGRQSVADEPSTTQDLAVYRHGKSTPAQDYQQCQGVALSVYGDCCKALLQEHAV